MSDNDLIRRGDALKVLRWEYSRQDRADITALPAADPLADPRVQALVEALESIDALDPESLVIGCGRDALSGLVNLMGAKARAALAAFKGDEA
jgi:hypothetical protein